VDNKSQQKLWALAQFSLIFGLKPEFYVGSYFPRAEARGYSKAVEDHSSTREIADSSKVETVHEYEICCQMVLDNQVNTP
jgi:hypothetical protein